MAHKWDIRDQLPLPALAASRTSKVVRKTANVQNTASMYWLCSGHRWLCSGHHWLAPGHHNNKKGDVRNTASEYWLYSGHQHWLSTGHQRGQGAGVDPKKLVIGYSEAELMELDGWLKNFSGFGV